MSYVEQLGQTRSSKMSLIVSPPLQVSVSVETAGSCAGIYLQIRTLRTYTRGVYAGPAYIIKVVCIFAS